MSQRAAQSCTQSHTVTRTSIEASLTHDDKAPLLDVQQTFKDLVPLEGRVLGTSVVEPDSLEGKVLLLIREETGGGDVGRKQEEDGDDRDQAN